MFCILLGLCFTSTYVDEARRYFRELHKKNEDCVIDFKNEYISSEKFSIFDEFVQNMNKNANNLILDKFRNENYHSNIVTAKMVFNFIYSIFKSSLDLVPLMIRKEMSQDRPTSPLYNLVTKLYFYLTDRKIFQDKILSLTAFYANKDNLGRFYSKKLSSFLLDNYSYEMINKEIFFRILWTEFNFIIENIKDYKDDFFTDKNLFNNTSSDTSYVMLTNKELVTGKNNIIRYSKNIKKVKKSKISKEDLLVLKGILEFTSYKLYFNHKIELNFYLLVLKYFNLKYKLNITVVICKKNIPYTCYLFSIDGTNINNIMKYWSVAIDMKDMMNKYTGKNTQKNCLHSFTTLVERKTYSFSSDDGVSVGKHGVLGLSCAHFIGKDAIKEWYQNFMMNCPYCRSHAFPILYFETELYYSV
jgi:hypothetical protein